MGIIEKLEALPEGQECVAYLDEDGIVEHVMIKRAQGDESIIVLRQGEQSIVLNFLAAEQSLAPLFEALGSLDF